jgi:hypothetical protein
MTAPAQVSPRVKALLARIKTARGRVIFALDATMSRQATWDIACGLQSEMFAEVGKIGPLEVKVVWFRSYSECRASAWTSDSVILARAMRRITCEAGYTQIGRVLSHIRKEHAQEKVNAAIFVGDACEEAPDSLYASARELGVPLFCFQEGFALATSAERYGVPVHGDETRTVETVFCEIARLSGGAYARFDAGAAKQLAELLRAIAAFASGGIQALANQNSASARLLLGQMGGGHE